MKLLVTPFTLNSIKSLAKHGADGFLIGHQSYANRLTKSFSELEIKQATELIHSLGKEVYVQLNVIVHNEHIAPVGTFLDFLKTLSVDGILFGDVAVYRLAKERDMESLLIYNPETLNTNYYDPIFWGKNGIKGLIVAKEITLKDLSLISEMANN